MQVSNALLDKFDPIYARDDGLSVYEYERNVEWSDICTFTKISLGDEIPLVHGKGNIIVERGGVLLLDTVQRDGILCEYLVPVPAWSVVIFDPNCTLVPDEEHLPQKYTVNTVRKYVRILKDRRWKDLHGRKIFDRRTPVVTFVPLS